MNTLTVLDAATKDKLSKARWLLVAKHPYFSSAVYALTFVAAKIPTLAVDAKWRCYVSPTFVAECTVHEVAAVLKHEIGHLLRDHPGRKPMWLSMSVWGLAADAEINDDLEREATLKLPERNGKQCITPTRLGLPDGLIAEQYAKRLLEQQQNNVSQMTQKLKRLMQGQDDDEGEGGSAEQDEDSEDEQDEDEQGGSQQKPAGEQEQSDQDDTASTRSDDSAGAPADSSAPDSADDSDKSDDADEEQEDSGEDDDAGQDDDDNASNGASSPAPALPTVGAGDCGSCSDGIQREWELAPGDETAPIIDEAEADLLRREVAQDILSRGNAPGRWKLWADQTLNPKVPWQRLLKQAVMSCVRQSSGAEDYTWQRPNRRLNSSGIMLPSLVAYRPEITVIGDTSGSMNSSTVQGRVLAEVEGIVRAVGADVKFLSVDTQVHGGVQNVRRRGQVKLEGGGGTDMCVAIDEALKTKPDAIVLLTDGETPWPNEAPKGCKVIVALIGQHVREHDVPTWAKKVRVDPDE